jgi:hypothetical protein
MGPGIRLRLSANQVSKNMFKNYQLNFFNLTSLTQSLFIILFSGCGEPLSNRLKPLLSYGNHTDSGEHPWQALMYILGKNNTFDVACGGTIVSPNFILTGNGKI